MLSFLQELIVAILSGYLAFTNGAAEQLSELLEKIPDDFPLTQSGEPTQSTSASLSPIDRATDVIPQILVDNAAYQQANVYSGATSTTSGASVAEALVNITCTYTEGDYQRTITGSGSFVSHDGVILTNAHIAQFQLLADRSAHPADGCTVRTGSPAQGRYEADILYIPPAWLLTHATLINDQLPEGTGERDYALLYVRRSVNDDPLPARFPALAVDTDYLPVTSIDTDVAAAGYPVVDERQNVSPVQATTSISELFTFGSNRADVMALRGTSLGKQGSSGGPVVNSDNELIGLIVTRGDDSRDGAGSLRAITLSHINDTITEETGVNFTQNITGNLPLRASLFTDTMKPFLTRQLEREL